MSSIWRSKGSLTSALVLSTPREDRPFRLQTDASGGGIGAVLSQQDDDWTDRPVGYFSRKMKGPELQYMVTEQDCWAVVEAIKDFSNYLTGVEFTVVINYSSLRYLASMKDENGRLSRWALSLQPYLYQIEHWPGNVHGNADRLYRQTWSCKQKKLMAEPDEAPTTRLSGEVEGDVTGWHSGQTKAGKDDSWGLTPLSEHWSVDR